MSMIRMYHIACDAVNHQGDDIGDEWYASMAYMRARDDGYHIKGNLAICPECWDHGVRYTTLSYIW